MVSSRLNGTVNSGALMSQGGRGDLKKCQKTVFHAAFHGPVHPVLIPTNVGEDWEGEENLYTTAWNGKQCGGSFKNGIPT